MPVSGHSHSCNPNDNWLIKIQSIAHYVLEVPIRGIDSNLISSATGLPKLYSTVLLKLMNQPCDMLRLGEVEDMVFIRSEQELVNIILSEWGS